MAKRICIINFKGGVGKTTLAFDLGAGLAKYHGSRVLLIDMDHQSSLSILCLGAGNWDLAVTEDRTVDRVFRPFVGHSAAFPGLEIVVPRPMRQESYATMDLVPASFAWTILRLSSRLRIRAMRFILNGRSVPLYADGLKKQGSTGPMITSFSTALLPLR